MDRPTSIPARTLPARTALFANVLTIAVSLMSIIGWICNTAVLASWSMALNPMAPSTAVLFLCFGVVFLADSLRPQRKVLRAAMALLALLAIGYCIYVLSSLASIVSLINLAANENGASFPVENAGKMSPLTAIGFLGSGLILLLQAFSRQNKLIRAVSETVSLFVFALGFICFIGYLYGMPLLYGSTITPMALPSAVLFIIIAVRFIVQDPAESWTLRLFSGQSIQSRLFRTFIPAVTALMVLTGWFFCHLPRRSVGFNASILGSLATLIVLIFTGTIIAILARWLGRDISAAHDAVKDSERKYRNYIENAPDGVFVTDNAGRFLEANNVACQMTGYTVEEITTMNIRDLLAEESRKDGLAHFNKLMETGCATSDLYHMHKNGSTICLNVKAVKLGETRHLGFIKDVTDVKLIGQEREATINILRLINTNNDSHELMRNVIIFLKDWSGCEAVGIRLKDGDDFPYFETQGFPAKFVQMENRLCEVDDDGRVLRDDIGNPALECMCGNILRGRFDPSKPFFTATGSFWSNCTTDLLASTTEADRGARTRNRCNGEGYESVALIPLKSEGVVFGLIQLNDKHKGKFSSEKISLLERLALSIAKGLSEKQAKRNLQESEKRYRDLVDNAGQAILIVQDGVIKFANPVAVDFTGYSNKELSSTSYLDFIHPDDRKLVLERHRSRLKGDDVPSTYSFRLLRKDRTVIWVEISVVGIEWEGRPATLNFLNDISERIRMDDFMVKNSKRMRSLVAILQHHFKNTRDLLDFSLNEAIQLTESTIGYIYYYNEESEEFTLNTWSKDVMKECSIKEPDTVYRLDKIGIWGEAVRQRQPIVVNDFGADNPLKKGYPQGHAPLYKFMTVPVIINGKIMAVAGVANKGGDYDENDVLQMTLLLDGAWKVKERIDAELALRESEIKYRELIENSHEGISISKDGHVGYANRALLKIFGYDTLEDYAKISMVDHTAAESRDLVLERMEKKKRGEPVPLTFEMKGLRKDGAIIDLELSSFDITINNEKFTQNTVRDVTEKQKLAESMQRTDKLESLGVLAGGIAHDFNNLLGGIFGYIDMAREESPSGGLAAKYLDKAVLVFNRAKDLTQQLLTFSRGGSPVLKTGLVGPLVKECATFALSGSKISCKFHIADGLWACDFDENQLGQVVDNIVINAQQAMPLGGTITVSMDNVVLPDGDGPANGGNFIRISITDTGVGIPRELLKRIFDPFFTTKQKGNGLGLATCYSIIEKHKGRIEVESEPGVGSTFHILLPASQKETGQGPATAQSSQTHKGTGKILVMDDEDFMREIIGKMLREMGYMVFEAGCGEEAVRLCAYAMKKNEPFSAAVLDLTIPGGMGGRETVVELLRECPGMPVFASSGFSEDPVMSRPRDYGFTDSIRKPYRKNELAEVLNRHMKTSSPSLLLGKEKGAEGGLR
ncbi:MAG: PAS domain S-box protein [Chitinivibrionales bacterium]